jgi:outer membrane protein insertion porin family
MGLGVRFGRGLLLLGITLGWVFVATAVFHVAAHDVAAAQTAHSIVVQGNRRVEADTVRSYFKGGANGQLNAVEIDQGLKALIATGLFEDVRVSHAGGRLTVTVVEAPVINRIAFEGNKKAKDEQISAEIQSKPRGSLSRPTVQADVQRILEIYHRSGRFDVTVDP